MLTNELSKSGGDSEEGFRRTLRRSALTYWLFVIVGVALLVSVIAVTNGAPVSVDAHSDYESGFAVGLGSAFTVIGTVRLMKNRKTLKDPEQFHKAYTEHVDERNRFIIMKTYQTAAMVFIVLLALGTIAAAFQSSVVASTLSVCMSSFVLVIIVVQQVVKRKY